MAKDNRLGGDWEMAHRTQPGQPVEREALNPRPSPWGDITPYMPSEDCTKRDAKGPSVSDGLAFRCAV
jgi:hypothetical protein